jgi:hypothetical protein
MVETHMNPGVFREPGVILNSFQNVQDLGSLYLAFPAFPDNFVHFFDPNDIEFRH